MSKLPPLLLGMTRLMQCAPPSSQAFYLRDQDLWTKIDYKAKAEPWMKPLVRGKTTGLVEIPGNWYLDDLPPLMYEAPLPSYPRCSPRHLVLTQ